MIEKGRRARSVADNLPLTREPGGLGKLSQAHPGLAARLSHKRHAGVAYLHPWV